MRRARAVIGTAARISAVLALLSLLPLAGAAMRNDAAAGVDDARRSLQRSLAALDACADRLPPLGRTQSKALLIYLAIENEARPPFWRRVEFALASIGLRLGWDIVGTIGIGQVSREAYARHRHEIGSASDTDIGRAWIDAMRDDCTSIAVLASELADEAAPCRGERQCVVRAVCRLHAGSAGRCGHARRFLSYEIQAGRYHAMIGGTTGERQPPPRTASRGALP